MTWWQIWLTVVGLSVIIGAGWLWLERRYPPHVHDEGDHDPHCPGCFAEKVKR